jgi:hypothetical protein
MLLVFFKVVKWFVMVMEVVQFLICHSLSLTLSHTSVVCDPVCLLTTSNGEFEGPSVALASAYPIRHKESISDFPKEAILQLDGATLPITKFSRPILRCVVEIPTGHHITVFVMHLKSKRPMVDDRLRHDQKVPSLSLTLSLSHSHALCVPFPLTEHCFYLMD